MGPRHCSGQLGGADQYPEYLFRGIMDPVLKLVKIQWGGRLVSTVFQCQVTSGVIEESMTAQVASKRNLALGEARTQKGHYLRIIFIKQEFTRQRREGKIDLTLSPFFFFFTFSHIGLEKLVACLYFRNQPCIKDCIIIITGICEEPSRGQANFWFLTCII